MRCKRTYVLNKMYGRINNLVYAGNKRFGNLVENFLNFLLHLIALFKENLQLGYFLVIYKTIINKQINITRF